MTASGRDWIADRPAGLAAQQALLSRLLGLCQDDDDIRWLVISCSLARGTVAQLDLAALLTAGQQLAALLRQAGERLRPDLRAALPYPMARYVTEDLASLGDPGSGS